MPFGSELALSLLIEGTFVDGFPVWVPGEGCDEALGVVSDSGEVLGDPSETADEDFGVNLLKSTGPEIF
jgi:hypothetical protein